MKKILFPFEIDNPVYQEAYIYAVKFARNLNTEVILLNAFSIEADNFITKEKYAMLIKERWFQAYNEIIKFNNYYLNEHARMDDELQIKFDHRFINGILKDEIREIAKEPDVGFIVLPVSDKKDFNKRQLDIIRDNIFEKNRVSLLVVPFQGSYRPIKNIVFSIDLKKLNYFKQYLDEIIQISRAFDSNVHFLNISLRDKDVFNEDSEEFQMIKRITDKNNRHVFKRVSGKDVVESVNQYVDELHADLLAVVKHQHFFLETLFHKSHTNEISFNSKVPVFVMRESEE
jgi:nucleotide-binding universal stress UspA family protein